MPCKIKLFLKSLWTVLWKFIVFLLIWAFLQAPIVVPIFLNMSSSLNFTSLIRLLLEAMTALTIVIAMWIMVRWIDRRPWKTAGFAPVRVIHDLSVGTAIGAGMILASITLLWLIGTVRSESDFAISWFALLVTGTAVLFNAATQEVLVRGYLFQIIQLQGGAKLALIATSIIFSLLHGFNAILPAVNLFLVGILLGLTYLRSGNLWLPIALHFGWNFLLGPVLGLTVSGQALDCGWHMLQLHGAPVFTGGKFGLEGGLAATLSTIAVILIIVFSVQHEKE